MKKYVIASIVLCLVAVLGVVIYFVVPKRPNDPKLVVDASNVEVFVGESKEVEYVCSIDGASVTFEIEDKSIATTKLGAEGVEVFGIKEGTTKMTIVARYKSQVCDKVVDVVVKANDEPSNPPNGGGNDDSDEETPPSDNGEGQPPKEDDEGEKIELVIPQTNLLNCTTEEGKLVVVIERKALFKVSANKSFTSIMLVNENAELEVEEAKGVGNNTYSVLAKQTGEYAIKITLDTKYEFTLVVRVVE